MLEEMLRNGQTITIRQLVEYAEWFGVETRNKYSIESTDGQQIGYASEQEKGFFGFWMRQSLGHWKNFEVLIYNAQRQPILRAVHPFRFIFQRMEVHDTHGRPLGALQQRFALFFRRFDLTLADGRTAMKATCPFWAPWTFRFTKDRTETAIIKKKWSGFVKEAFTDADNFRLQFSDSSLTADERLLLLVAAIYIDVKYFERKARRR
jgi:uncharacterized protein YxjI